MSRWKVEAHGAEEDERDILCTLSLLFILASGDRTLNMLRDHLPLRGHRSFTFYKLFFNRRPKLENEHVLN